MSDGSSNPDAWRTAITEIAPNRVAVRGYDIAQLMGNVSFGQAVYLILKGDLPDEKTGRLMEAILVASIDHGATPPSALAARTVASTGATLSASVAAGIMSINKSHGGAIENCARSLMAIVKAVEAGGQLVEAVAGHLEELKGSGRRMAGFGHRIHSADPRTARLFELAQGADANGQFVAAARAVEAEFVGQGKSLPINVDGAIAAVLCELGFEPGVMNGLFMIARVPGLVAHVNEEQTRMKPMRKIDPVNHTYDGPAPRSIK